MDRNDFNTGYIDCLATFVQKLVLTSDILTGVSPARRCDSWTTLVALSAEHPLTL